MLHLHEELVPYLEALLPPLRAGNIRPNTLDGDSPLLRFAWAFEDAGEHTAREVLEMLNVCPAFMFDAVCRQLNSELEAARSKIRVKNSDLSALKDVVARYWTILNQYV
jgi:hypothetical protein